jgi:hypothetical protein
LANPNVFSQFAQPYRSFEDYSQQYEQLNNQRLVGQNMQQQNAIRAAAMADAERQRVAQERQQNALTAITAQAGGDESRYAQLLRGGGYYDQAQKLEEGRAKIGKESADTKAKTQDTQRKAYEFMIQGLQAAPDPQTAAAMVRGSVGNTGMTMQEAEAFARTIPSDPQAYQQWRPTALRAILAAKDQLPKIETRNLGGTTDTIATDVFGGGSRVVNSARNTMTPGESARLAEDKRQFGVREARMAETDSATVGKPFEVTGPDGVPILVRQDKKGNITRVEGFGPKAGAGKPLNDAQSKALLFGSRMQESDKILTELESQGVMRPGAISQSAQTAAGLVPFMGDKFSEVAATATNFTQSAEQQRVEQARRDFINAVLRRESGAVISPSEFANAERQYFPAAGDKPEQIAQKRKNRALATRGILQEVPEGQRNSLGAAQPKANAQKAGGIVEWGDLK